MGFYGHHVNTLLSDPQVQNRETNTFDKDFNSVILQAAKDPIPKGFRCNYKPVRSNTPQERQETMNKARQKSHIVF